MIPTLTIEQVQSGALAILMLVARDHPEDHQLQQAVRENQKLWQESLAYRDLQARLRKDGTHATPAV